MEKDTNIQSERAEIILNTNVLYLDFVKRHNTKHYFKLLDSFNSIVHGNLFTTSEWKEIKEQLGLMVIWLDNRVFYRTNTQTDDKTFIHYYIEEIR